MEGFFYYRPSVPAEDLEAIHHLLRAADVFVPSFHSAEVDPYHVMTYVYDEALYETKFVLLADRNVVSRWVSVLNNAPITESHRLAAAVLAFSQAARFLIEPNIALYEFASTAGEEVAQDELSLFRIADEVDLQHWCAIALGRSDQLPASARKQEVPNERRTNLSKPLYRWRRNYILALKIAQLQLQGGPAEMKMKRLLEWMYYDFLIGGPAVLLGSLYFAPGLPRRRLFKGLESPDRERALAGIRNAAWDLSLLSEWVRYVQRQQSADTDAAVVVLCSFDTSLRRLARMIVNFDNPQVSDAEYLQVQFAHMWGPGVGHRLAAQLSRYQATTVNPDRQLHREAPRDYIDLLIKSVRSGFEIGRPREGPRGAELHDPCRRLLA